MATPCRRHRSPAPTRRRSARLTSTGRPRLREHHRLRDLQLERHRMPGLGHQRRLPQLGSAHPVHHRTEEGPHRHHRGRLRPRPVGVELPRERPDRRHGIVLRLPEQQAERVQHQVLRKASLRRVRRQRRTGRGRHMHPGASEHHLQDRSPGALRGLIPRPELWNDHDDPRIRRVHLLLLADCHDLRRQHPSEDHSNREEAC